MKKTHSTKAISWILRHLIPNHRAEVMGELLQLKMQTHFLKLQIRETQNIFKSGRNRESNLLRKAERGKIPANGENHRRDTWRTG